jgi:hypothetical protein
MKRTVLAILLLRMWLPGAVSAQGGIIPGSADASLPGCGHLVSSLSPSFDRSFSFPDAAEASTLPVLSAELAMARFQRRSAIQSWELASYSATSLIQADLPDTAQHGEYEVQRTFTAPHTLLFKPIRFVGDRFVKVNIIARLLQSEVDHAEKNDIGQTAINPTNYKLSYKGRIDSDGQLVHVFQIKPYKKHPGLFKGRIYLEAHTGSLTRAEGRIVKSPSVFLKHIEFEQEYADFGLFTLPVHTHTVARAFLVGRMIIDIRHANYQPVPFEIGAAVLKSSEQSR